jgi:hypothetical protein
MDVSKAAVSGGSSHRSSKLTLTPLTIPPSSAFAHVETVGDRSTPALSLETPGRPGSARLAPLRNPPQAPPAAADRAPNLPDVDRAPFVPQRLSAYDGSSSDDDTTFAIDLKPADHLLQRIQPSPHATAAAAPSLSQPASAAPSTASDISISRVTSVEYFTPLNRSSTAASSPQPRPRLAGQSPVPVSALDSGLSKREKQMLQLLSPNEQDHLHSHALGSVPNSNSSVGGSFRGADSGSIAAAPGPTPNPSNAAVPASSVSNLSRKGSDVHSDGSWDDDEIASGARRRTQCLGLMIFGRACLLYCCTGTLSSVFLSLVQSSCNLQGYQVRRVLPLMLYSRRLLLKPRLLSMPKCAWTRWQPALRELLLLRRRLQT